MISSGSITYALERTVSMETSFINIHQTPTKIPFTTLCVSLVILLGYLSFYNSVLLFVNIQVVDTNYLGRKDILNLEMNSVSLKSSLTTKSHGW